jgi:hypothetical protein
VTAGATTTLHVSANVGFYNANSSNAGVFLQVLVDGTPTGTRARFYSLPGGNGGYPYDSVSFDDDVTVGPGTHQITVQAQTGFSNVALYNDPNNFPSALHVTQYNNLPYVTLANSGQTVITGTQNLSGLNVSRQVTVLNTGSQDFARTVDYFQNPTGSPITTTVHIVGNLGSDAATRVFAASSGDNTPSPSDEWFGTDGVPGTTAVLTFVHGPNGLMPTTEDIVGDNIEWTYTITVQPGQTLELATFTIQAGSEANAVAEANALVTPSGFGGHAADFLSSGDLAALANFQFNSPPTTIPGGPYAIQEGGSLSLDGTGSSDPDGDTLAYSWTVNGHAGAATGATPTLTWAQLQALGVTDESATAYPIQLAVDDGHGHVVTANTTLAVSDAALTNAQAVAVNTLVALGINQSLTVTFTDPGFSPAELDSGGNAVDYGATIHWNDGSGNTTGTVVALKDGLGNYTGAFKVTATHNSTSTNTYTIAVLLTHDQLTPVEVDVTPPTLTLPADQTFEATSAAGALVHYTPATVTDPLPNPTLVHAPANDTQFALGTTTVTATATDAAGNQAIGSFHVKVVDTTPPILTVPGDQSFAATSAAGAFVHFTPATATDLVSTPVIAYLVNNQSITNDSQFPLGTTTVVVTATDAAGNQSSGSFHVTLKGTPVFSGSTAPTITYGTATDTISGHLAFDSVAPTGSVSITLNGIAKTASLSASGDFSYAFDTSALAASSTPYPVSFSYPGDPKFTSATGSSTLTINKAAPTVYVTDAGGTYNGQAFAATATVTGVGGIAAGSLEGVTPTLTYYAVNGNTQTALAGAPSQAGTYTVVASFAGSADYAAASAVEAAAPGTPGDPLGQYGDSYGFRYKSELVQEAGKSMAGVTETDVVDMHFYDGPGGSYVEPAPANSPYAYLVRNQNDGQSHDVTLGVMTTPVNFVISPKAASVTPDAKSKTYGDADPTLTGTLSGFLAADNVAATYSRTTGETVAGGPYTISAALSPAGVLSNYSITYNTAQFTITTKAASVTPDAKSKTYGDADPTLTGSLSGFLAADNVTAAYNRTAGETVAGGPYTISATLSPGGVLSNYAITYNTAQFTINTKAASVTPDAKSKTYGDLNPTLTGTLSGFLAVDNVTATYSRTAGETVAGGPYTISATLSPAGVLSNYAITYNTAQFTITTKAASVTPDAKSKTYGDADPTLTGTLSGFLAADNVIATYGRTAGETVAGGPYTISATLSPAGVLSNYAITYYTAQFTINTKAASVTPDAKNKTYGDLDPSLTGTLSGFLAADNVIATYGRTAGETVVGGPYTISATLSPAGVLSNYAITYNTAQFTITKRSATWTTNANSKTYGDADPNPLTTGSGSNFVAADGVTATYSRAAGETVLGGTYHITATLSSVVSSALANYTITNAGADFIITTKAASVTPDAKSKAYGDADPTLTGTLSGFLATDSVKATYSRTAGETVLGGPYTISATLSPAGVLSNYAITYNTAQFTITTKAASVTPDAKSKTYGDADPTLTGTLTGFLTADNVTASYSRSAGETAAGGPYSISATLNPSAVLSNYAITYNTAQFTINKRSATWTTNANSKTYGDADPAPLTTGSGSNFVAADGVTASYSRVAGETVLGGAYHITAALSSAVSGALTNYTITNAGASFSITAKAASVTPDAKSKTYGDADPTLTGTLVGFLPGDGVTASYSRTAGETVLGGPYTIRATLSPTGVLTNYAITYNTASFTINKRSATWITNGNGKTYGDHDPNPLTTGSGSNFLAADGVTASYSRAAGETVQGGPYHITATLNSAVSGALNNYAITNAGANFTIGAKSASVTPDAKSKTYGDADPALTGTLVGFLPSDGVTASYSRTAGETVLGGPYTISASLSPSAVLSNYAITYNTAKLTITTKTASVTPNAASKTYGTPDPTFTGTLSGFLVADNVIATYGRTAGETVAGGPYTISATLSPTSVLSNYAITYNTANFSITKAMLTVAADNKGPVQYSDPVGGGLTAQITGFAFGETLSNSGVTGLPSLTCSATTLVGSNLLVNSGPNTYSIVPSLGTLSAANYGFRFVNGTLTVAPEDARVAYTGSLYANTGSGTSATLTLSATVLDISNAALTSDPAHDPYKGDIRNATVSFDIYQVSSSGSIPTTPTAVVTAPIGLVNAGDTTAGTATTTWTANIGSSNGVTFDIVPVIGGYYTRNTWNDAVTADVYQNVSQSITGGGYLVLTQTAGQKAGDVGSKANFGFNIKFNNGGNLQGNANIMVRRTESDGTVHVYQIKSNSLTSLAATTGKATFSSKATITDTLTGWGDGNCQLQIDVTDNGDPGPSTSPDKIGITLWDKTGGLYFSSNWGVPTGQSVPTTIQQAIAGGNLVVHSNQLLQGAPLASAATAGSLDEPTVQSLLPRALAVWQASGFDVTALRNVAVAVADLSVGDLAFSANQLIAIDRTAQGYGWFTDATHLPAADRVDLLTVLVHELGHQLGFDVNQDPSDVMDEYLAPGVRRLSTRDEITTLPAGIANGTAVKAHRTEAAAGGDLALFELVAAFGSMPGMTYGIANNTAMEALPATRSADLAGVVVGTEAFATSKVHGARSAARATFVQSLDKLFAREDISAEFGAADSN